MSSGLTVGERRMQRQAIKDKQVKSTNPFDECFEEGDASHVALLSCSLALQTRRQPCLRRLLLLDQQAAPVFVLVLALAQHQQLQQRASQCGKHHHPTEKRTETETQTTRMHRLGRTDSAAEQHAMSC